MKKTRKILISLWAGISAFSLAESRAKAAGDFVVNPAITAAIEESKRGGSATKDTTIRLNVGAGTIFGDGIYAGLKYYSTGIETQIDTGSSNSGKAELVAYGLSAGYISKANISLTLSYLLNPELRFGDDSSSTKLYGGSGYLIDFGWRTKVGQTLAAGPLISYLSVNYKKMSVNNTKSDLTGGSWQDTSIYPYFGFWLFF